MTSYVTPKKNAAFILYIGLSSQGTANVLQSNPTIAAGDFKVSTDGGALANLATLPTVTPAASKMVKISLSASEMNGDNVTVVCSDVAGAEWCDVILNIQTSARQIDDLSYPATSGRSMVVDAAGLVDSNMVKAGPTGAGTAITARDIGASVLLSTGTGTGQLDFTSGVVKANATQFAGQTITAAAGVTLPTSVASPTNITAGTITTVTNLTNAPTAGDLTSTMKTSVQTAADAAVTANALVNAIAGYIDTEVSAIKTKTDQLHFTVANQVDANALTGGGGGGTGGAGAISVTITIDVSGLPKDGVAVWATTDLAGLNVSASGTTDAFGHVTFMLDAGTYYAWKQLAGYDFTNPESFVVS